MSDFERVAAVGDADLLFGLRALGIAVFSPRDSQEAREIIARLEKEKYALCLVHQRWTEALAAEKEDSRKKTGLIRLVFSDYRDLAEAIEKMVKEMAIRATGSDSLVKRKGQDESS
ncbi:MAG: V-type ATP synthase subunit F [Clostridiales bacterium]|nr:V-type ATP synthase subunit F [Clostridiales bacterium]